MPLKPLPKPLTLRIYPDSVLRQICAPVETFDTWLSDVAAEMLLLMRVNKGIGLAGPQVGITQRMFVSQIQNQILCMINPVILSWTGRANMAEGCLSLPDVHVNVKRHGEIEVAGYSVRGLKQRYRVQGLWARVVQHEIDHLDGRLIIDYQAQEK